jgi:hypothetical protein
MLRTSYGKPFTISLKPHSEVGIFAFDLQVRERKLREAKFLQG